MHKFSLAKIVEYEYVGLVSNVDQVSGPVLHLTSRLLVS